jgi:hypothetical protein
MDVLLALQINCCTIHNVLVLVQLMDLLQTLLLRHAIVVILLVNNALRPKLHQNVQLALLHLCFTYNNACQVVQFHFILIQRLINALLVLQIVISAQVVKF